jgi:hypothetical protein
MCCYVAVLPIWALTWVGLARMTYQNLPRSRPGELVLSRSPRHQKTFLSHRLPLTPPGMDDITDAIAISEAFYRLRWPVFEDASTIQVADDPESPDPELSPFVGHEIAMELATETPTSEIGFTISDLDLYESDGFESPDRVIVRGAKGGPVTVADVVEQLIPYFLANKEAILEAKGPFVSVRREGLPDGQLVDHIEEDRPAPPNTRVFFDGFHCNIEPDVYSVPVQLWAEGESGISAEDHWKGHN